MLNEKPIERAVRRATLIVRVNDEQKRLVEEAAEYEGLEVSSFLIMLLVRAHILPEKYAAKLRRRPVLYFNELHSLLGVLNNIGGNCKQLFAAYPVTVGLRTTHAAIDRAAMIVTDALHGKLPSQNVNFARLEKDLVEVGYAFNDVVRSVNMGKPQLSGLRRILADMTDAADHVTVALTDRPNDHINAVYVRQMAQAGRDVLKAQFKLAAKTAARRSQGTV